MGVSVGKRTVRQPLKQTATTDESEGEKRTHSLSCHSFRPSSSSISASELRRAGPRASILPLNSTPPIAFSSRSNTRIDEKGMTEGRRRYLGSSWEEGSKRGGGVRFRAGRRRELPLVI